MGVECVLFMRRGAPILGGLGLECQKYNFFVLRLAALACGFLCNNGS